MQDEEHVEASYVLYRDEFPHIQAIYRYADELPAKQQQRRQRECERAFHPGLGLRLERHLRNFLNLISDSLSQAIGILIGQVQARTAKAVTVGTQDYLSQVGQNIIGYVGTRYDPLLERYVGTQVVVEVTEGGKVYEHVGILRDYTADYLAILDVHYPHVAALQMAEDQQVHENKYVRVTRRGAALHIANKGDNPLYLESLNVGGKIRALRAVLDRDDEISLELPDGASQGQVELSGKVVRRLDWILPRSHALIRHKAERYDPDQVFDIGFVLKADRYLSVEDRCRAALKKDPSDASTAVELGQLLAQRGMLDEAELWFRHALAHREKLPDGGKLAVRQLLYVERKRAELKSTGWQGSES